MKRFQVQSQGDLRAVWNVLDTQTGTYAKFGLGGRDARSQAVKIARQLNKLNDKKENNMLLRFLSIILSMGIVMAFATVGVVSVAQVRHITDWHFVELLLLVVVPLSWLVALAITNRE